MPNFHVFTCIDPDLLPVFEELRRREPTFHTPEFGAQRSPNPSKPWTPSIGKLAQLAEFNNPSSD